MINKNNFKYKKEQIDTKMFIIKVLQGKLQLFLNLSMKRKDLKIIDALVISSLSLDVVLYEETQGCYVLFLKKHFIS